MPTDPALADELVATVRGWVAKDVIPFASEFEHADEFPEAMVQQMREFGLFGATIPEEYGGLDLDVLTYARLVEELAYGWMSLSGILNTHTIVVNLVKRFGTDEQRERWLPDMATGEIRGAFSLSEPDSGSDSQALRTKAVPDGDEYVIDGTKMWVTNGERAAGRGAGGPDARGHHLLHHRQGAGPPLRGHLGQPQDRQARLQGPRDRRDGL